MSIQNESAYQLSYQDQSLFDRGDLSLTGLKTALQNQNPRFSEYFVKFVQANIAPPALKKAKSEGKYTYIHLLTELRSYRFKSDYLKKLKTENPGTKMYPPPRKLIRKYIVSAHQRLWEKVEATEAQPYLPERLNAYQMILALSKDNSAFAQASLLDIIQHVPLKWGPWRAIRQLYKDSIAQQNWKLFSMILARIDHSMTTDTENRLEPNDKFYANASYNKVRDVSRKTLAYLSRKGWRTLRKIALFQPYLYTHIATDVLLAYPSMKSKYDFNASWVYNHIVNHNATYTTGGKNKKEVKVYQAESFYYDENTTYQQHVDKIGTLHAFPELWQENPKPILKVFELARHDSVINFAKQLVLKNFDYLLKPTQADMSTFAQWIELLSRRKLSIIDEFILNWFQKICPIPQAEFHLYGLHKILLNFLFSQHQATANYAIAYVQAHYKSLISEFSIDQVISYLRHSNANIRKIAELLLDPVHGAFKLTLAQCTELIEDSNTNALAQKIILSSFNGADFSFEWYETAINHKSKLLNDFALQLIKKPEFLPTQGTLIDFYWQLLSAEKPTTAGIQFASTALKEPYRADLGVDQSSIKYDIKADQMKAVHAFTPLQVKALFLHPNEKISQLAIDWISKGPLKPNIFDQAFLKVICDDEVARNDQSYLAGLPTLQLKWFDQIELEYRHYQAGREWLSNLRYFGIEDLGYDWYYKYALKGYGQYVYAKFKDNFLKEMPIWGLASTESIESLKGLKGENLKSAKLKAIKEGFDLIVQKFTSNKTHYYEIYLIEEIFRNRHYAAFQKNHPDRKLPSIDIGIPAELLSFEIYRKFAFQNNYTVKDIAQLMIGFDLSRWCIEGQITFQTLLDIFSNAPEDVRSVFLTAMSRTPKTPEERIDLTLPQFKPEDLFQFCLSSKASVRDFALRLIKDYPERYAKPSELARLMDSSDRRVCETAVKILYQHFHQIQGTQPWAPYADSVSPSSSIAKKQITLIKQNPPEKIKAKDLTNKKYLGVGTPEKTLEPLVSSDILVDFFKRTVFQIPHTHPLKADLHREDPVVKAWKNKVTLIKVLKDIALEDQAFAKVIAPLFRELLQSRGQSEQHACLTAIVQLRTAYPELQLSF